MCIIYQKIQKIPNGDSMKNKQYSRKQVRIISYLLTAVIVLSASTLMFYFSSKAYKAEIELSRQRALSELSENIDAIVLLLQKGQYSNSQDTLNKMSASLNAQALTAKAVLSEIDDGKIYTDDIYKFLSQIGDYTNSVSVKFSSEDGFGKEDKKNLSALLGYAQGLSDSLERMRANYYDGEMSFEESKSNLQIYKNGDEPSLFSDSMEDASRAFTDYPSLVYDGPFSDHMGNLDPKATKGLDEVSRKEAKAYAAKVLGVSESELRDSGDETGKLYLYCFSTDKTDIGITKNGCKVCYVLSSSYAGESTVSEKSAMRRGKDYLEKLGYKNMESNYFSTYDGICTVNYAYVKDGITHYPDLIKVSVSLDTGKVVSLDARTYLMNHTERELGSKLISQKVAKKMLSKTLTVTKSQKALIPTDSGKEHLCYEFLCHDDKEQDVLVYIDAVTGEEREILLLLYTDGGRLTI